MASRVPLHLILIFLFFIPSSIAEKSLKPHGLVLPVTKDQSNGQYNTLLKQRTPLVPLKLTVDLGGEFLWVDCTNGYVSSSFKAARCGSAQCSLAKAKQCGSCEPGPEPGCNKNNCLRYLENPVIDIGEFGEVSEDVVSLQSTNGKYPGPVVSIPGLIFLCGAGYGYVRGLSEGVEGVFGLGRGRMGVPSQLATALSFRRKFALCLGQRNGVIFFGDRPYGLLPNVDVSKSLIYTPLLLNPVGHYDFPPKKPSAQYYIGVKSIQINGQPVPINTTLLTIDKEGHAGTKISTGYPYTVMETSIYNAFTAAFAKALAGVPQVEPVSPFKLCYDSSKIGSAGVGPDVPPIDLVLQNKSVVWRIFGVNSMVRINVTTLCLAFVEASIFEQYSAIIIGGHQIEDNLLQFDLSRSRLGFSSLLWLQKAKCSNFKFKSNA